MTFGYDTQPFRDTNLTPSLSEARQLLVNFTVILRNISKIEIVASIIAVWQLQGTFQTQRRACRRDLHAHKWHIDIGEVT